MLDPIVESAIRARLDTAEFPRWMGFELIDLGEGSSAIRLALRSHHLNPGKIAHGGVVAAILDAAIGLALRTRLGPDATHVTVDLHVNYLRPVQRGTIEARGRAVKSGERVGYGEADLFDARERLLARAQANFLVVAWPGGPEGDSG